MIALLYLMSYKQRLYSAIISYFALAKLSQKNGRILPYFLFKSINYRVYESLFYFQLLDMF